MERKFLLVIALCMAAAAGCTTNRSSNTARTAMEQLLISNAVDQSLDKIDFRPLAGANVYLDEKYVDCIDKNYVIASVRHRVLHAGARIVPKPEEAEIVLELRTGGVGTDQSESFVGMPEVSLPGPLPVAIPEIRLWSRTRQTGTAKIGIVAYDAKTHEALGQGGATLAQSDDNNWYLLGVGPFQNGSVRSEVSHAQGGLKKYTTLPNEIAFSRRSHSSLSGLPNVQLTGGEDPAARKNGSPATAEVSDAPQDAAPPAARQAGFEAVPPWARN